MKKSINLIALVIFLVASTAYGQVTYVSVADSMRHSAEKKVAQALRTKDIDQIVETSYTLAELLHTQSNYVDEIEVLLQGLEYLDAEEYSMDRADFFRVMGEAARATRKFEAGLEYLHDAEQIYLAHNDTFKLAKTYNRMAAIYFEYHTTDADSTFAYADRSIAFADKLADYEIIANNYDIKGAEYRRQKKYTKALSYSHRVIALYESNGKVPFPNVYVNLCILYYRMENYADAIKYGEIALDFIGEHGSNYQLETLTFFLSSACAGAGDFEQAYHYANLSNHYQSVQFNEKKDAKIAELNKKYHTEKQEDQIMLQQEKIKSSDLEAEKQRLLRNMFIVAFGVMIVIAVFMLRLYKQRSRAFVLLEQQKMEIEDVNAALEKSNLTKDRFLSIIAHDLRSPVGTLCGFSKMLTEHFDQYDTTKQKHYLGLIGSGLNKTYKLLEDLLLWARSQKDCIAFKPQEINLFLLADENCELFIETKNKKTIALKNTIPEDYSIVADKRMISTVLRNLISNALKFTPKGGEVVISAETSATEMTVFIKDNGLGMSEETQLKLFDIAENISTKGTEDEAGTGLGLVLCKDFMTKHHGRLSVESRVGVGSVFSFSIPKGLTLASEVAPYDS